MTAWRLIARDVAWRSALLPVAFFLIVITLGVFGAGSVSANGGDVARGLIWSALFLAFTLPVPLLFAPARASGVLDQLKVAGFAPELIAACRMLSLFLSLAPPLLLATVLANMMLGLAPTGGLVDLCVGMAGLSALAILAAALTGGTAAAEALAAVVVLPIAIPMLIFGAGGATGLLAASALVLVAVSPFAAGTALKDL